ncbi:MAG: amino acid adenylation domain-containing protein, partial [Blastocatellia bacterium]
MQDKIIEGFRLSPQQKHIWRLQQNDQSSAYAVGCALLYEEDLNVDRLQRSLNDVVGRYEILRTTFEQLPGMPVPVQAIADALTPGLKQFDLSDHSLTDSEKQIDEIFCRAINEPFDFEKGPLMRVSAVRLTAKRYVLIIALTSLCSDQAALKNLVNEIGAIYSGQPTGTEQKTPTQYADFAEWQCELLDSEDTLLGRKYWSENKVSDLSALKLPCERAVLPSQKFTPNSVSLEPDRELYAELESITHKLNISAPEFLIACWSALLWHLTGKEEIAIGVICDGRKYAELNSAIGLFAKNLPLRCHLDGDTGFTALLSQIKDSLDKIMKWQDCFSLEQVIDFQEGDSHEPFFPYAFSFESQSLGFKPDSIIRRYACIDRYKVNLSCRIVEDSFFADLEYDAALFDAEDINRLAGELQTLVRSAMARPDSRIGDLEILTIAERKQILEQFNQTFAAHELNSPVFQSIWDSTQRNPHSIAVTCDDQHISYGELDRRANQLANYLRTLGVEAETLVAVCTSRSIETIISILGTLKAGGAYVPLDHSSAKDRLAYILENTKAQVLLCQRALLSVLPAHSASVVCVDEDWESISRQNERSPSIDLAAANPAYVIYTSGSTGLPKGVAVTHRNLTNSIKARTAYYGDEVESFLLISPFAFDSSVAGIFGTLCQGGRLIIAPETLQPDPAMLVGLIARERPSYLLCLPSLWKMILDHATGTELSSVEASIVAGEACSSEIPERHKLMLASAKLYNEYGPTEATVWSTVYDCALPCAGMQVPIGRPIDNTQIYILNDCLQPVAIGVAGELFISGEGLSRGYIGNPDLTAEKFIPNPFAGEQPARLYRTGDLARYASDGNIEFLGRSDHQVKIRGYRIELGEIEANLKQHGEIKDAVVLAREDSPGDMRLVAYLITESSARPAIIGIRQFIKGRLPDYMVPSSFVLLNRFPLTRTGKVDRKALPAPDSKRPEIEGVFLSPRTPVEEILVGIWSSVLKLDDLGIHDNFFELGGHSLLATQVTARLQNALKIKLIVRDLFDAPTIAQLAARVEKALRSSEGIEEEAIKGEERKEAGPLSYAQQRLWFMDQLDAGNPAFNVPAVVEMKGDLNVAALEQSMSEISRRQHSLRTAFRMEKDEAVQEVQEHRQEKVAIVELSGLER